MESRRVIVTGATGFIGSRLVRELARRQYEVVVFSRNPARAREKVSGAADYVAWEPAEHGAWESALDGAGAVVNLAGASVGGKRWNANYKREIANSRIVGTRGLVNAIAVAKARPAALVSMSVIGYYGHRDATPLDESALPGDDFLARVGVAWEQEARKAEALGVRVFLPRTGIVLGEAGGALSLMALPIKCFVGGPIMPGSQYVSWIHVDDEIAILAQGLDDDRLAGPINATAPNPVTNREFNAALGRALGRPSWLPAPGFAVKAVVGEFAESVTTGQRVIPRRLLALGYEFKFPTLDAALRDIYGSA